jgi:hypothetical protein
MLQYFHTPESFQNVLSWGNRQIPYPIEELVDLESISYNRWRQAIVRIKQKRKRVYVDIVVVYMTEEPLFDMKSINLIELVAAGVEISHATIDKARVDKAKVENMKKELEFLRN